MTVYPRASSGGPRAQNRPRGSKSIDFDVSALSSRARPFPPEPALFLPSPPFSSRRNQTENQKASFSSFPPEPALSSRAHPVPRSKRELSQSQAKGPFPGRVGLPRRPRKVKFAKQPCGAAQKSEYVYSELACMCCCFLRVEGRGKGRCPQVDFASD